MILVIDVGPSMHNAIPEIEKVCSLLAEKKVPSEFFPEHTFMLVGLVIFYLCCFYKVFPLTSFCFCLCSSYIINLMKLESSCLVWKVPIFFVAIYWIILSITLTNSGVVNILSSLIGVPLFFSDSLS